MRSLGVCPKCNSNEIYTNRDLVKRGDRSLVPVSSWKGFFIDVYVCASCGYMEEYMSAQDRENPSTMEKLRTNWKKM